MSITNLLRRFRAFARRRNFSAQPEGAAGSSFAAFLRQDLTAAKAVGTLMFSIKKYRHESAQLTLKMTRVGR